MDWIELELFRLDSPLLADDLAVNCDESPASTDRGWRRTLDDALHGSRQSAAASTLPELPSRDRAPETAAE